MDQLYSLCGCENLYNLNLENNPITKLQHYRTNALEILSQLKYLDEILTTSTAIQSFKKDSIQELELVKDSIKTSKLEQDGLDFQHEPLIIATSVKPNPSEADLKLNPQISKRPSSALPILLKDAVNTSSPLSSGRRTGRPTSAVLRPASASIRGRTSPMSSPKTSVQLNNTSTLVDEPIDLTFGSTQIVCGNLVSSIRKRKQEVSILSFEREIRTQFF